MAARKFTQKEVEKELSYGSVFFLMKNTTYELRIFDKEEVASAKREILQQARSTTNYATFIKAATKYTGLSESQIKKLMKPKELNEQT